MGNCGTITDKDGNEISDGNSWNKVQLLQVEVRLNSRM